MSQTKCASRCSQVDTCEPFRMFALRGSLGIWASYCEGEYERCARYRLSRASGAVPENLLPNGRHLNGPLL